MRFKRAPKIGTRVTFSPEGLFDQTYYIGKGLLLGRCGTIGTVFGGKGAYCDPMNRLVAVDWDGLKGPQQPGRWHMGGTLCVPPKTLVQGCSRSTGGLGRAKSRACSKARKPKRRAR